MAPRRAGRSRQVCLCLLMAGLASIYCGMHVYPQARSGSGKHQMRVFVTLSTMFLMCLLRTAYKLPGTVPQSFKAGESRGELPVHTREAKKTGDVRKCKWCGTLKPDRCHHCRACGACILKMDHHCPWIRSCVGFYNYKYFLQVLLYATTLCIFMSWTMGKSTMRLMSGSAPLWLKAVMCFGEVLLILLSIALALFASFHLRCVYHGQTTLEFCEKLRRSTRPWNPDMYNLGPWQNFKAVFGPNPLLWLIPFGRPEGDGLSFPGCVHEEHASQAAKVDGGISSKVGLLSPVRRRPPANKDVLCSDQM
ncbi:Zdhhc15 [Symbiodinium natans]|uniref:Palmitoyltransferase n=1 Tax=Symbiodinium natans TaxID=878477 RepID=A0A812K5T2_9DINO|nr:Zdhhc15 [Symbiodinium natans]